MVMWSTLRKSFDELDEIKVQSLKGIDRKINSIEDGSLVGADIEDLVNRLKTALIAVREYGESIENVEFNSIIDEDERRLDTIINNGFNS